jgi:hypothetical protein
MIVASRNFGITINGTKVQYFCRTAATVCSRDCDQKYDDSSLTLRPIISLLLSYLVLTSARPNTARRRTRWCRINGSINGSITGTQTDALVPYADMLNHLRPRQTRWTFDNDSQVSVRAAGEKQQGGVPILCSSI